MPDHPSMPNYRIAWVISGDEVYGVKTAILNLMQGLEAAGHAVGAVAIGDGSLADELEASGRIIERLRVEPPRRFGRSWKRRIAFMYRNWHRSRTLVPRVARALASWDATAAHVLWPILMPVAGAAAQRTAIPCFWEMPNIVGNTYPFQINRRYIQWTCHRLAVQPLSNSAFTASTLGSRPVKPIVMHLGVDPARFDPAAIAPAPALADARRPVFGVFARIDPTKGQLALVQALARIEPQHRPTLAIVGGPLDDEHARHIKSEARRLGVDGAVTFTGPVTDVERFYAAVDVVVNARTEPEPFGLTVVEAMLMSKPVLAHAVGGPAETIVDSVTGWHVPGCTPEDFANAIRRALRERERWRALGDAGRQRALTEFTIEAETRRYLAALEARLITPPPPAP